MPEKPAEKNTTAETKKPAETKPEPAAKNTTAEPAAKNTTAEPEKNNTIVKKVKNLIKHPEKAKEEEANDKIKNATGVDVHKKAENFLKNAKKPILAKRTTGNDTKTDEKTSTFTKFSAFLMMTLTALVL